MATILILDLHSFFLKKIFVYLIVKYRQQSHWAIFFFMFYFLPSQFYDVWSNCQDNFYECTACSTSVYYYTYVLCAYISPCFTSHCNQATKFPILTDSRIHSLSLVHEWDCIGFEKKKWSRFNSLDYVLRPSIYKLDS